MARKFAEAGLQSIALTGEDTADVRDQGLRDLKAGARSVCVLGRGARRGRRRSRRGRRDAATRSASVRQSAALRRIAKAANRPARSAGHAHTSRHPLRPSRSAGEFGLDLAQEVVLERIDDHALGATSTSVLNVRGSSMTRAVPRRVVGAGGRARRGPGQRLDGPLVRGRRGGVAVHPTTTHGGEDADVIGMALGIGCATHGVRSDVLASQRRNVRVTGVGWRGPS